MSSSLAQRIAKSSLQGVLIMSLLIACAKTTTGSTTDTEPVRPATKCTVAEDCQGSDEERAAGRCGPEVTCRSGECHAECLGACTNSDQEPCSKGGICAQPIEVRPGAATDLFLCTRRAIHCQAATDCPLYKPSEPGEWTCGSTGVCEFPGFTFEYD